MTMVVSPHEMAIVFRPNSPRPPSGTTSTAGAPRSRASDRELIAIPARRRAWNRWTVPDTLRTHVGRRTTADDSGRWESLENGGGLGRNYSTGRRFRSSSWPNGHRRDRQAAMAPRRQLVGQSSELQQLQRFGPAPRVDASRASTSSARCRAPSQTAPSAFAIVLRRCVKTDRTMADNQLRVAHARAAAGERSRRTTADRTLGAGRNAPGGSDSRRVDVGAERRAQGQDAVFAGPRRRRPADPPPLPAA